MKETALHNRRRRKDIPLSGIPTPLVEVERGECRKQKKGKQNDIVIKKRKNAIRCSKRGEQL